MAYLQRNVVFIAYARRNAVEVEAVSEALESFGAEVLYDGKFSTDPGSDWTKIRDDFIRNSRELLILTTPDIFIDPADPDCLTLREQIQVEVALAQRLGKPIRAIILDRPAFNRLLAAGIIASSDEQMTDLYPEYAINTKGLAATLAREKLRMRAIPGMRQYVLDLLAESRKWADQRLVGLERNLLPESTLSDWRHLKDLHGKAAAGLYLITGPGGEGKTVLVCREFFRDFVDAIHIPMSHLTQGLSSLAEFLQAEPDSIDETIQLWGELWGIYPVFYIDALEHTLSASKNDRSDSNQVPDDPSSQYVPVIEAIRKLATVAPVIATARPEIWSSAIQWILHPDRVVDITGRAANQFHQDSGLSDRGKELLGNALFIDHFLKHRDTLEDQLDRLSLTEYLLHQILNLEAPHVVPSSFHSEPSHKDIYRSLANLQLESRDYRVPIELLAKELLNANFAAERIHSAIQATPYIQINDAEPQRPVRLSHDLLDAANCARAIRENIDSVDMWFDTIHTAIELQISEMLLRMLGDEYLLDRQDAAKKKELHDAFDCLLRMLDLKKAESWRAWMATWTLEALVRKDQSNLFAGMILDVLDGPRVENPPMDRKSITKPGSEFSRCFPAQRTVACVSSLASLWRVFEPKKAPIADRSIAVLGSLLSREPLRFRIVEALTKYDASLIRQPLIDFARVALRDIEAGATEADPPVLAPLALALRSHASSDPNVSDTLAQIMDCPKASRRAARIASNAVRKRQDPPSEEEILEEVRLLDRDRPNEPSDWQTIHEYSRQVRDAMRGKREFSNRVLSAFSAVLDHQHAAAAQSAATVLGQFPTSDSIDALLIALATRERPDAAVWTAIHGALREIAQSSKSRWSEVIVGLETILPTLDLLEDSTRARAARSLLIQLVGGSIPHSGKQTTTLVPSRDRLTLEIDDDPEIAKRIDRNMLAIASIPDDREIGPELEEKWRICLRPDGNIQGPDAILRRSTWRLGRGFHRGLELLPTSQSLAIRLQAVRNPAAFTDGAPGLAVVHVLCELKNGSLLAARRPESASYAPGCWSVSLEEQIQSTDLEGGADQVIRRAALRGMLEEFAILEDEVEQNLFEALILEHENLNVAFVVGVRLRIDLEEIQRRAKEKRASHGDEVDGIRAIERDSEGRFKAPKPRHPTSEIRIELLRSIKSH